MKNPRVLTVALALLIAPVPRAADGSLSFDGSGDFVEVPNFHTLGITDEVTIEFWAKTNTDAVRQSVFMLSPDVSTNRFQAHISTFNGTTYWDFGDIGAGGLISVATPSGEVGSWTHYAVSGSAKDNFMRFYVNGLERDYVGRFNPLGDAVASVMRIGGGTSYFFNGSLDDFRVWNVARSTADIQRDMTGPLTGREAGLRLYFTFDEGAGTSAVNRASVTGEAFNGTLNGNPTWSTPARTTYTVDTTADENDTPSGSSLSLREALRDADADSGPALITFAPALNGGTIPLGSEIIINDAGGVVIDASDLPGGVAIRGGGHGTDRIITVISERSVALNNLTLTNGGGVGNNENFAGGGAIYNYFGTLTLTHCALFGNSGAHGGAIANPYGTLALTQCSLSDNFAAGEGGAISNNGTLTLAQCTISGNSATSGGAIYSNSSFLMLTECSLSGNSAMFDGGSIYSGDALTLTQCSFSSNSAMSGGAIFNIGTVALAQCTLSGNSASIGGAIDNTGNGSLTLTHCTLSGNSGRYGGGVYNGSGKLTLANSIVAGNTASGDPGSGDIHDSKLSPTPTDYYTYSRIGANIVMRANSFGNVNGRGPTAITDAPLLAPLGHYGGPTHAMALLPGSPARDAAVDSTLTSDQRGFPIVGVPDIGAYEAGTTSNYNAWIHESLPGTATPAEHEAAFDYDGDRASNQAEWEARTHPANDQDFLGLTAATFSVAESNVTFTTKLGVNYRLQVSNRPGDGWMSVGTLIAGTGSAVTVPVVAAADGPRAYRVAPSTAPMLELAMVTVGNPGNADDPSPNGLGGHSGAVAYEYKIGKYEVTNGEYVPFLNAVDPNGLNALALYNARMGSDADNGGITLSATNAAGAKYEVKASFANKPVVYVSFYDALRFCNWLHNGARAGGDTENGAYTLLGNSATPSNETPLTRNAGATFALPSENEWYKAAYHQPAEQGGPPTSYWFYPTGSDSEPSATAPPGTAPAANLDLAVGSVTTVGAYATTAGFYGTFDMAGNVFEWEDTVLGDSSPVQRGDSWSDNFTNFLQSNSAFVTSPGLELKSLGFRVSSP